MKQTALIIRTVFFILLLSAALTAQDVSRTRKDYLPLLDKYIQGQAKINGFNGNVLVAKNGNVVYQKSFGYGNFDTKELLNKDSRFNSGSIAKQFTAMAILQLKEKGKLSLDDKLQKFFPELPYPDVTVRQMLTHTSGLPEYFDLMLKKWDLQKVANNNDIIRLLADEKPPVFFKPGEDLKYSNASFDLLASIIEKVTAKSWTEYITEHILEPLGMTNTRAYETRLAERGTVPGVVYGFLYSDTAKKWVLPESLPQYKEIHAFDDIYGSGGIDISTGDLFKWDRALKNHTLINEAMQNEMLSIQSAKNTTVPAITFGYGTVIGKSNLGNSVFHAGSSPGFKSMIIRYVDADVTAIVLSNNESQAENIADGLCAIALDKRIQMPYVHKEARVDSSAFDKYTGRFMLTKVKQYYGITWPTAIVKKEGKLFLHLEGSLDKRHTEDDIELKAESPTKFFYADGTDRQIEFETDTSGRLVKIWQITWGLKREVREIE